MTDKQLQKFLASVRRTRFVDYLDPLGETAQKALERRLQWARVSQGDPASSDEAKFLLENAEDLREVLRRELDEDDWVEDTSAGREFDATARKAPKVRENARVSEMFQSDDLRSVSADLGVTPKRPSGAAFARPQLAVRTPVPAADRERKVSVRVGGAPAYVEEEDEEDPDEMPTGIMRIEDVTNPSLKTAIREASPRPTQTRSAKAPSVPPPAAKGKPPPASLKVGVGRRSPVEEDDEDAPSADPAWGRGGRTTPPPPPPIPAPLRSAKLSTPPPSIARSRTAPPAGTGAKVVLGTSPPAVPRIRPSEGQLGAPARRGSPPNRLLLFALLGVAAVAIVLVFALPALVSFGRGDRVVVAEPVEAPAPVVMPAPVAPPVEIPAPPEPVVAVAAPAPAPAPVAAPEPRPVAAPAPAPEPVASTPKPEPAPIAAPAPAPTPAPVVAAAVVPEVPAEPVEAAPAPPAFPLKGTWASSTLKLTVRNQAGTSFDGTAEVRQDDGSWTSIPVKGSVDGSGSLAFEGGAMSFGGTAKGGVAKGNVIRGEGKDAEPVQLVRF